MTALLIMILLAEAATNPFASRQHTVAAGFQDFSGVELPEHGMEPRSYSQASQPPISPSELDSGALFEEQSRSPLWVFPPDDRQRVSPADRRIALYLGIYDNGNGYLDDRDMSQSCTSTLIGARVLLTAAHCLYSHERGGWPTWFGVVPGANGNISIRDVIWAEWIYVTEGWVSTEDPFYDFGLIILSPSDSVGRQVGNLPIGVLNDRSLSSRNLWATTIGYPADKPAGTQWITAVPSIDAFNDDFFTSQLDQTHGQSGSAVFRASDSAVFGIISFGTEVNGQKINVSRRVNTGVLDFALDVCKEVGCSFDYFVETNNPSPTPTPQPTQTPTPTPSPQPTLPPQPTQEPQPTPSQPPSQPPVSGDLTAFQRTWERTDWPVSTGQVSRTWMWGPAPFSGVLSEAYRESPGEIRAVQYFDKSRMEISNPSGDPNSIWYVTNGLLVTELASGRMQVGDSEFVDRQPAQINVAGDADDPTGPTYATFQELLDAAPLPADAVITQFIDRSGQIGSDASLMAYGVTATHYVPETNHRVASVFWEFMNSEGIVFEDGSFVTTTLFLNPFYATGLPISEPYWASVKVAGEYRWVLIQAFERRVLTYTPGNPNGFEVEAGNVGQHYYRWRYGS